MKLETPCFATIALGTNLGDRLKNLQLARDELAKVSGAPLLQAPVYATTPVNCPPDSPDFLNTVIAITFDGSPEELLGATQSIQAQIGREASSIKNAPRVIDIDILTFGDIQLTSDQLTIPHPRIRERRFVLQPLADILPNLQLPRDSCTISEHLALLTCPSLTIAHNKW